MTRHLARTAQVLALAAGLLSFAAPASALPVQASVNNYSRLPGGVGLVDTLSLDLTYGTDVAGWNIAIDQSAALNVQAMLPSPRIGYRGLGETPRLATGLHDLRVSATRSIGLGRGVQLDLLGRATLPTGKSHYLFGAGRKEVMLDAGLRRDIAGATVWFGGARRFRKETALTTGRDINEFYAGITRPIDEQSSLRFDYLLAQSEYAGGRLTSSMALGFSRDFDGFGSIEINASSYKDAWVESKQGLVSVRVPTKTIF